MKLYELPRGAKLMVRVKGEGPLRPATFHHIDGMYSLCSLSGPLGAKDYGGFFHLYAAQEMVPAGDPITHYELAGSSLAEN